MIFVIDLDSEGKDILDLGRVFADPGSRVVPSPPQRGGFFSRGSSVSVTTIRGADGVMNFIYFMYMNLSRNLIDWKLMFSMYVTYWYTYAVCMGNFAMFYFCPGLVSCHQLANLKLWENKFENLFNNDSNLKAEFVQCAVLLEISCNFS